VTYAVVKDQTEAPGAERESRSALFSSRRLLVPLLAGIFTVLVIAGLRFARSLLVPIAVALLLTLLLGPLVRGMRKYRVLEPVGAALIVFGTMIVLGIITAVLADPAAQWLRRAPETLRQVEWKLRDLEQVTAIQATATSLGQATGASADSATQRVRVVPTSPLHQLGWTTANVVSGLLTIVFLTYFLLASGTMFRRKIAHLFPSGAHRTRIKRALFEIEDQMSRYLLINTLISIGVGIATWALLAAIGMPNPVLWGAVAGILSYIPYLGALVTVLLIGIVALASFDGNQHVLLACGGFLVIDLLKGYLLAPLILGRGMPLNTVAVLVSLLFWGWVWGIAGVIMAVPLTVMIQVICSHSERFRAVGVLLGNWGAQRVT
jgi:predicted PurR-regulated permease PerM